MCSSVVGFVIGACFGSNFSVPESYLNWIIKESLFHNRNPSVGHQHRRGVNGNQRAEAWY